MRGVFNVLLVLSKQNEVQRKSVRHFQLHLVLLGVSKSALMIVPIWYKEAYTDNVNQGGRGVKYQKCHLCPDCGQSFVKEFDLRGEFSNELELLN